MSKLSELLRVSGIGRALLPAYPDGARLQAQLPHLRGLLGKNIFRGRILNAGCGEGLYSDFLESFAEVERIDNIDISFPTGVATRPDPRNHVAEGSLTKLPYESEIFDACLCTEVIEHIHDHDQAVSELSRVLKPGALLLASVPQNPAPYDPNHARQGYDIPEFHALLERNGFHVLSTDSCFFLLMRGIMHYWRNPVLRFGAARTPYIPSCVNWCLAKLDNILPLGKPWDLCVLAEKKPVEASQS